MKLGIIKEGKTPPDKRVPLSPEQVTQANTQFNNVDVVVEPSNIRIFKDELYAQQGAELTEDLSKCDVLMGVKEVPIKNLIANKTYFFFSHTIKEQPYNRNLLRAILEKNITLLDWEVLTQKSGARIIGFGRYAGIVGAFNGLRAWGFRHQTFELKKAEDCADYAELKNELKKVNLRAIKIAVTGRGRVANGALEILKCLEIKEVTPEAYITETFTEPVYAQLGVEHYNKRKDGTEGSRHEFYQNFTEYNSDFLKYAAVTDFYIAGHFYAEGSPFLYTRNDAKQPDFKIKVVADISCDIDGPVATTIRPSTIADPFYGYLPNEEKEANNAFDAEAITVMAVDNLPCELPKDASEDFGKEILAHILPLLNGAEDKDQILERATITRNGQLTEHYAYLQNYVDGKA